MARKPAKPPKQQDNLVLPKRLVSGAVTGDQSSGRGTDTQIPDNTVSYFNKSIADVRRETNLFKAMRLLTRVSGDVGSAVAALVSLANTPLNTRVYDGTHNLSQDGAILLKSILAKLNYTDDYSLGYDHRKPVNMAIKALLREAPLTGAVALELVLDDNRLPFELKPVSASQLKWKVGKQKTGAQTLKIFPYQLVFGKPIDLDIPTFFYSEIDPDLTATYSKPMLEPALNSSIYYSEMMEDIRRAVKQSGHSRLTMTLVTDMLLKAAPMDVKADPNKLSAWMSQVKSDLETDLQQLSPESALVMFDTVKADYLNSEIGARADYTALIDLVDGQQSTALRTPPSVLGKRIGTNQNTASTETLLFLKTATSIQPPVAAILSRALTLAVRLYGFAGYVEAEFDPIDLRPEHEIAAFKSMDQARILELLSLGFLNDDEASELLGTGIRPPGAPALSGTFFYKADASSTTPSPNAVVNSNNDPARRALSGNAPKNTPGKTGTA